MAVALFLAKNDFRSKTLASLNNGHCDWQPSYVQHGHSKNKRERERKLLWSVMLANRSKFAVQFGAANQNTHGHHALRLKACTQGQMASCDVRYSELPSSLPFEACSRLRWSMWRPAIEAVSIARIYQNFQISKIIRKPFRGHPHRQARVPVNVATMNARFLYNVIQYRRYCSGIFTYIGVYASIFERIFNWMHNDSMHSHASLRQSKLRSPSLALAERSDRVRFQLRRLLNALIFLISFEKKKKKKSFNENE